MTSLHIVYHRVEPGLHDSTKNNSYAVIASAILCVQLVYTVHCTLSADAVVHHIDMNININININNNIINIHVYGAPHIFYACNKLIMQQTPVTKIKKSWKKHAQTKLGSAKAVFNVYTV